MSIESRAYRYRGSKEKRTPNLVIAAFEGVHARFISVIGRAISRAYNIPHREYDFLGDVPKDCTFVRTSTTEEAVGVATTLYKPDLFINSDCFQQNDRRGIKDVLIPIRKGGYKGVVLQLASRVPNNFRQYLDYWSCGADINLNPETEPELDSAEPIAQEEVWIDILKDLLKIRF